MLGRQIQRHLIFIRRRPGVGTSAPALARSEFALLIRRDGILKDVSFIDPGQIKNDKLKRLVLQAIRGAGPFPAFPKNFDSEQELFQLRFGFQKAES